MDITEDFSQSREQTILQVRELSRRLVRELGFMRPHLADSGLAPSAVHAIIEVGLAPGMQARELASVLRLDKSNASRQLAKLEALGLLRRETDPADARASRLYLTRKGAALRERIDRFATDQVSKALRQLTPGDQQALLRLLALYGNALSRDNPNLANTAGDAEADIGAPPDDDTGRIEQGYVPGCIGDIAALHARYYARTVGFGVFFERKVATELGAYAETLPAPGKGMWLYTEGGRVLGSVVIDGDMAAREAHLRWFIVDETLRGRGVGRALLGRAMDFADAWYDRTCLWTFRGLDAARHLYESVGFGLAEEAAGSQWGEPVTEQRFIRPNPSPAR
ncbi:bifunctional helix-turn-helix transcriptional regulator/GNAT family N-acetyltransferase [Bordetella bronchialis]|uniref:MarR family transcriptional regulator n=1 Tax=Bordetella bronchialis TaxID=463025 RepID=A0A193FTM9_9BORD|nr:bifunctional helix-turn-helix transcriptional regulator/GNAT family N-acetyltransferase [Bordetella bronchialis]ANN70683.1 MarR family transcriptional regulator [Bordetella bronchialis]